MSTNEFDYLKIKPIKDPIPPKKQEAKRHYGVHPYFTRRAYNVVQAYIQNFTQPGDLVLDPFGGSGVTAIESLVLKRRVIHVDINPLANYLTYALAVSPVDLEVLRTEFQRVKSDCTSLINKLENLTDSDLEKIPIKDWYPKNIHLPSNADRKFVHELFSHRQLMLLARIRKSILRTEDIKLRTLLLYVFSATVTKCNLLFSGARGRKQTRGNTSPIQVYRYWMPPTPVELDPWEQFQDKFKKFIKAKEETNIEIKDYYSEDNCKIIKGNAADLSILVADESIDYVYTDPPYGAHIAYLDLSTMWNAWLELEVDDEDKKVEIIEGGDLNKSKDEYTDLLRKSIEEIFRVLKYDRWFSLVFAHKDPLYWDTIVKSAASCGFEYVNMAVVKAGIVSYHKHKNPLRVLSGEMVINFLKKRRPRALAVTKIGVQAVDFILNSAELSIVQREDGATTEEIHFDLIPKLVETGLLTVLQRHISDITPMLGDKFDFNSRTGKWLIQKNTKLGSFIPLELRIRFYIESFLADCKRLGKKATLEDIWADVIPKLKNGDQPTEQVLTEELRKIAEPYNGQFWRPQKNDQFEMFNEAEPSKDFKTTPKLPEWRLKHQHEFEHDEIIYRLALIAGIIGFNPHIGHNERVKGEYSEKLTEISLDKLPRGSGLTAYGRKKVEQIDIIWFDIEGFPAYAFEIENTTSITSGIERFTELLKLAIQISGKMILVCPASRKRKLDEVLSKSAFVGHPMYMENKLKYLYYEDVFDLYQIAQSSATSLETTIVEIRKRLRSPGSE
ncbi:MAG: DNA methyltransferase [bacterium]|nr:DNA methyltransferase [bacterium]